MKITALETFLVKPRWVFLKVSTDAGLVGWGEPAAGSQPVAVARMLRETLQPRVVGQEAEGIEALWLMLSRGPQARGDVLLMAAVSGLEQALWDLKGKACGLPVHQLLGGACRPRVRLGTVCGGATPQDAAFQAKGLRLKGYTAITLEVEEPAPHQNPAEFLERTAARLAAIRGEVGKLVDITVDLGGRLAPALARRLLPLLEPHLPLFIEDPCPPEALHMQRRLADMIATPLAGGRHRLTRWAFGELLEQRDISVWRPDAAQVGGVMELRKLAAMAEPFGISLAPRHAGGPIGLAAAAHVNLCTPNFIFQEHPALSNKWDLGLGFLKTPLSVRDGGLEVPKGPGLGIEILEDALRERALDPDALAQEPHGHHA